MSSDAERLRQVAGLLREHAATCRRNGVTAMPGTLANALLVASGALECPPVDSPSTSDDPLLVGYREAAGLLRVSYTTVRRLADSGELPTVAVAGAVRIRTTDLERYVAGRPARKGA